MGVRFEIPFGESYSEGVIVLLGQAPTVPVFNGRVGLFIGDNVPGAGTNTNLIIVAIAQCMAAMKKALTNEGEQSILDKYNIRNPLDPVKQVSNDVADATEDHVWIGYEGTILESSRSELFVAAVEVLTRHYKDSLGAGSYTQVYAVPAGVIVRAAGTYASAATFDLTGEGFWKQGTLIDIAGTTDAGPFGLNAVLPRDMVLPEVGLLLAEFLKGWSQSTFKNIRHPADTNVVTIGMLAFAGGLVVSLDSLVVTPVP